MSANAKGDILRVFFVGNFFVADVYFRKPSNRFNLFVCFLPLILLLLVTCLRAASTIVQSTPIGCKPCNPEFAEQGAYCLIRGQCAH